MASDGSLGIGLDSGDLERIGNLAVTQLAELRHRGAFSTVSQTFAACCMHCSRSQDSDIRSLPRAWYNVGRAVFIPNALTNQLKSQRERSPLSRKSLRLSLDDLPVFRL